MNPLTAFLLLTLAFSIFYLSQPALPEPTPNSDSDSDSMSGCVSF